MNDELIKKTLSINQQIKHLQERGITFVSMSIYEAKKFLLYNNYFYKLYAYRKNFNTRISLTEMNVREYIDLDFFMLVELSKFDRDLRYLILEISLDVEHGIKRKLINEITRNPNEQNGNIVKQYLEKNATREYNNTSWAKLNDMLNIISNRNCFNENIFDHKVCNGGSCYKRWMVWEFLEVMDYGNLIAINDLYSKIYSFNMIDKEILLAAKSLRNASAHNSCLIDDLHRKYNVNGRSICNCIIKFAKDEGKLDSKQIDAHIKKTFIYTLLCLLYAFNKYCGKNSRKKQYKKLYELLHNSPIFTDEKLSKASNILYGTFSFLIKIVDNLYKENTI